MITSRVKQYIADNKLLEEHSRIIVGVSGGADSVALLDILVSAGYECIVAHCNFHLRGKESDRDATFVKQICDNYKLPYYCIDFNTESYAKHNSISIEMAARELRYAWFEDTRVKYNADCIAIAHHQDDSVETILLNLIRGTGIRGLTGIAPRNGYIIRPLLSITRNEILTYLNHKSLSFVDDQTNFEDIYTRNKIRLNIIPLMETINPSAKDSINRTAMHLGQVERIYNSYIRQAESIVLNESKIDIKKLLELTEPRAVLFEILTKYHFNSSTIAQIFDALHSQSGKIFLSDRYRLVKDRDYLILKEIEINEDSSFSIDIDDEKIIYPLDLSVEIIENASNLKISKDKNLLYADYNKLTFPLTLRRWQQGDWFIPFGMKGKRKISDFFSDQKFNIFEKNDTWLLCSGENIIWIVGHRSDDRYKIDNQTTKILRISLNNNIRS